ncbi:condensation domain-containing protein [Streptomyces sp. NBC_00986]|uniref:condensation domain-containing protein n=1 Tax=Streptomyces sp. NBC_00986 TaxID=2903702 RepID=UPI00386C88F0|nr:condensation domain-containing protein [Streptomyces sp. NBC_00986]
MPLLPLVARAGASHELQRKTRRLNTLLGEADNGELLPLSSGQQRLWFLEQFHPASSAYTVSRLLRVQGPLRHQALRSAVDGLVARHEMLRTRYATVGGRPVQLLPRRSPRHVHHLAHRTAACSGEALGQVREAAGRVFDVSRGPLFEAVLTEVAAEDAFLLLRMHHSITDAWSSDLLVRDLLLLYELHAHGHCDALPETTAYRDFIAWEEVHAASSSVRDGLDYWRGALAAPRGTPALLGERQSESDAADTVRLTLPPATVRNLSAFCRRTRTTSFMVLLAVFLTMLRRHTTEHDLVVGTPVANRRSSAFHETVGYFSNTLALRTDLPDPVGFPEVLSRVRDTVVEALTHDDVPLADVVRAVNPERGPGGDPLSRVAFSLQPHREDIPRLTALDVRPMVLETGTTAYDLVLDLAETGDSVLADFVYRTGLLRREEVRRMAAEFVSLLEDNVPPV